MSNVLVTGGYGFIGSHLVSALLRRGDTVTVFDLAKDTRDSAVDFDRHANFRFVRGDVTDLSALEKALIPGVDTVFHLAAVVGVKRYLEDPLQVIDVNVTGTRNVLELSQRHGAHVVLASTSEVFGKTRTHRSPRMTTVCSVRRGRRGGVIARARRWPSISLSRCTPPTDCG